MTTDNDDINGNEGGDGGDGDGPSATERSRPRPKAQVSFRLPRPSEECDRGDPGPSSVARSDPGPRFPDAPRNRRRLFKDVSFTNRPLRRENMRGGMRGPRLPNAGESPSAGRSVALNREDSPRRLGNFRGKHRGAGEGSSRGSFRSRLQPVLSGQTLAPRGDDGNDESPATEENQQYYIPPPEESNFSVIEVFFNLYSMAFGDLAMWVYGASFGKVLLFFFTLYFMMVYFFVVILYLLDKYLGGSSCINASEGGLSTKEHFELAFELSWTTLTTVGYGNLIASESGCFPVRFVCSVEAILGMAFVSLCSALFYAKLLRLLGKAPVTFSSTLCVQYGEGLEVDKKPNATRRRKKKQEDEIIHPFPVIEFRIVNNRANHAPGRSEIWDAEVTAIVQLSIEHDPHENNEAMDEFQINKSSRWRAPTSQMNDSNDKTKQKVFYKLALKPSFHPYFSRVWFLRHTLDATSPLLRREVRNMIRDNPGGWDPEYDNYRDIRACLVEFNSLQVLMSGASALSRSEVFAEKVYKYEDVCVGWRYIAVCYEEDESESAPCLGCKSFQRLRQRKQFSYGDDTITRVDLSLIHDIVPQKGGDYEPVDD
ncbi:hypothetical protein ACHAWF_012967 [Thalassiosira exigua]